jgi:hypothetical protein
MFIVHQTSTKEVKCKTNTSPPQKQFFIFPYENVYLTKINFIVPLWFTSEKTHISWLKSRQIQQTSQYEWTFYYDMDYFVILLKFTSTLFDFLNKEIRCLTFKLINVTKIGTRIISNVMYTFQQKYPMLQFNSTCVTTLLSNVVWFFLV